ncbi:hypothetical protein YPPY90_1545, partial [Yersinia pestis PY-90]
MLSLRGMQSTT